MNNGLDKKQFRKIHELEDLTKKNITIVNLSKKVEKNSAVIAGLDQANGDYTSVIDLSFWENPMIISNLYNKIQSGFDIVYFRQSNRKMNYIHTLIYKMIAEEYIRENQPNYVILRLANVYGKARKTQNKTKLGAVENFIYAILEKTNITIIHCLLNQISMQ